MKLFLFQPFCFRVISVFAVAESARAVDEETDEDGERGNKENELEDMKKREF